MQLVFALEFGDPAEEFGLVERRFLNADPQHRRGWGPFARELARATWETRESLDLQIQPALKNWTVDRLPVVDRSCLRMALCEMREFPDIPLRVTINEYIELARQFSTDDAPQYINAVLDRLAKDYPQKDFQAGDEPAEPARRSAEPNRGNVPAPAPPPPPPAMPSPPSAEGAPPRARVKPSGWVLRSETPPKAEDPGSAKPE